MQFWSKRVFPIHVFFWRRNWYYYKYKSDTSKELFSKAMSEWVLFNTNSAIFQLYHGENKLFFNEMMLMTSLY